MPTGVHTDAEFEEQGVQAVTEAEEPAWLTYDQVVAIHSLQLRRFGGAAGLRDEGLLRSALERPANKWRYERAELTTLAAAYAFGLAKNHAFVDGNKRIAFMSMVIFLRKNAVQFAPDQANATAMMMSLAAGEVSEESLARWIRDNLAEAVEHGIFPARRTAPKS